MSANSSAYDVMGISLRVAHQYNWRSQQSVDVGLSLTCCPACRVEKVCAGPTRCTLTFSNTSAPKRRPSHTPQENKYPSPSTVTILGTLIPSPLSGPWGGWSVPRACQHRRVWADCDVAFLINTLFLPL